MYEELVAAIDTVKEEVKELGIQRQYREPDFTDEAAKLTGLSDVPPAEQALLDTLPPGAEVYEVRATSDADYKDIMDIEQDMMETAGRDAGIGLPRPEEAKPEYENVRRLQ